MLAALRTLLITIVLCSIHSGRKNIFVHIFFWVDGLDDYGFWAHMYKMLELCVGPNKNIGNLSESESIRAASSAAISGRSKFGPIY